MRLFVVLLLVTGEAMAALLTQAQQAALKRACLNAGCRQHCNIAHPSSCFNYVVCSPATGSVGYNAQEMPCAFGTMWNDAAKACDLPKLAGCLNEPCSSDPHMIKFPYTGYNCRAHWQCVRGRSEAACCGQYQRFVASVDGKNGTCVNDLSCEISCPLVKDPDCTMQGVTSLYMKEGNCNNYYACVNQQPHPVCCGANQRYDVFEQTCVPDMTCTMPCSLEITQGGCQNPAVTSYKMPGPNCRTYMKCDSLGGGERRCCKEGFMYDTTHGQCAPVNRRLSDCEFADCPTGYTPDCSLGADPLHPNKYIESARNGGYIRDCAVGTVFDVMECKCVRHHAFFNKAKSLVCKIDIDVKLPNLTNKGNAPAVIMELAKDGHGEKGVGNMAALWDGKTGVSIPYYGNRELPSLFLEIAFTPTGYSPIPQILLTSCIFDSLGVPSLEIRLVSFQNNTGNLHVSIGDTTGNSGIKANVPYEFNVPYIFKMIYDSKNLGIFLETANNALPPISDVRAFKGLIPIHYSGLRFANCDNNDGETAFIGSVSRIQFSKCLTDLMKQILKPGPLVI